jgi:hypothetical protein
MEAVNARCRYVLVNALATRTNTPVLRLAQLGAAVLALAVALVLGLAGRTTAAPPDSAPGGPIVVITSASNPFSQYYAEILRAEGLNEFALADISTVNPSMLANYDVAILGDLTPSPDEVTALTNWVEGGGNLIAMRPRQALGSLLGLSGLGTPLPAAGGYLQVDTSTAPGAGIVGDTIQYHGDADRWSLNGARSVAGLFTDASTSAGSPAVTLRNVGTHGGQAAAFTYDLARSVVTTRQGNPAWAGQERDGEAPIRADDMFFGGATAPDWIDLSKVAIPQADEQQRLLANLIGDVTADRKPLPRFWYLPRDAKAAVVMTGDDHGAPGDALGNPTSETAARFNSFVAASPAGCDVAAWECIRGTSYIYQGMITPAQASAFTASGFEVALHVTTSCNNFTLGSLTDNFSDQLRQFRDMYPALPAVVTNRTHCIPWSDWSSHAAVELANGIRFDTNYYYWPAAWVNDRPGFFTGSGMPMRFGDINGSMIDVYQAATQMNDEAQQTYPFTIDTLLDRALGADGYYGVFTANMHNDLGNTESATSAAAIVASAKARSVPVVSSKQMLTWVDGRNDSSFGNIAWSGGALSFTVHQDAGANGLRGMLPIGANGGSLSGISRGGNAVAITRQRIKGVDYAFFDAAGGSYVATYGGTRPPGSGTTGSGAGGTGSAGTSTGSAGTGSGSTGAGGSKSPGKGSTAGCLTLASNVKHTVRGRVTRLTVTVRKNGRAAAKVRVDVNGAGVGVKTHRTDSKGRARFTVRPRKTGSLRVRAVGQRASCKAPIVSITVAKKSRNA